MMRCCGRRRPATSRAGRASGTGTSRSRARTARGHTSCGEIEPTEADVIRRIFRAVGSGPRGEGDRQAVQRGGRTVATGAEWTVADVGAVVGACSPVSGPSIAAIITWNRTRKAESVGPASADRATGGDWMRHAGADVPDRVGDECGARAHTGCRAARAIYLRAHAGGLRPAGAREPSKYLLTGLAQCGECGGGLIVTSAAHGRGRANVLRLRAVPQPRADRVCAN